MRVVVTGHRGQLGRQLLAALAPLADEVVGLDLPEHDISELAIRDTIVDARPDVIVHSAAMTDVDGCARDPDRAYRVNAIGTRNVALAAQAVDAPIVAISTNEVFDGAASEPYDEFSPVSPINPYGRSKAAGEAYVRRLVPKHYIVRTAWLFGPGGANFVTKILQRAESGSLSVVVDEVGSPTYAPDLAQAIAQLVQTGAYGVYHLVNEGYCSRFEFARAIVTLRGLTVPVQPTVLSAFPRPSRVPRHTPLRNFVGAALGIALRPWHSALEAYLAELPA
ncbi:MAG: dTDP-4-dehydrorhamnose reductase [Dehalococcoidia bacterium]|nr:dTDP-4-dehydrorhamnose reductase [Dehalococcoidia bacterium]